MNDLSHVQYLVGDLDKVFWGLRFTLVGQNYPRTTKLT